MMKEKGKIVNILEVEEDDKERNRGAALLSIYNEFKDEIKAIRTDIQHLNIQQPQQSENNQELNSLLKETIVNAVNDTINAHINSRENYADEVSRRCKNTIDFAIERETKNVGNINIEDSNSLFTPLNLICETDKDTYMFNYDTRSNLPSLIFLYALLVKFEGQNSISFDDIAELALIFCLTNNDLLNVIKKVCDLYPSEIVFSDVAGIKELQFRTTINSIDVLNRYYEAN